MIYRIENINNPKYTDSLYETAYKAMSPARQKKADRLKHMEDKKLCVFSDMLLRAMLKTHFDVDNPEFYLSEKGKPGLAGDKVYFSISHSVNYIACAVDLTPIGIDIEVPRTLGKKVLEHCCTKEEAKYICSYPSAIPDPIPADSAEMQRFLTLWTAKEAYLKYTGEGLGGGLKNIIAAEDGKLKSTINERNLSTVTEKDYVLSIVYESR